MDQTFSSEELARLRVLLQATSTVASASPTGQISPPTTVSSPLVSLFSQPPSQSSSRSLTTQPPPIVHLYQSSRQQSLPQDQSSMAFASSSVPTARFQPYSGIGTLGLNLPTGHANQARMASASSSIPRPTPLPRRSSRRTRGPAHNPPVLAQARKASIDDCLVAGATLPTIRIKVLVYPPIVGIF